MSGRHKAGVIVSDIDRWWDNEGRLIVYDYMEVRMTDPISVLLIIGAAVVGPIEARMTDEVTAYVYQIPHVHSCGANCTALYSDVYVPTMAECLERHRSDVRVQPDMKSDDLCFPVKNRGETLDQLCERAMREVGVVDFNGSLNAGWLGTDGWRPVLGRRGLEWPTPHVRCIPTPAGYRR